jgi:hypothetical protein
MSTATVVERPELRGALDRALVQTIDRPSRVATVESVLSPYSSSFRVEHLSIRLEDGQQLQLMLKDLSWRTMLSGARSIRSSHGHDPQREAQVYRRLLPAAPAGPPRLFGAHHDPSTGDHWLFLEQIDGLQLRHVGAMDTWHLAAAWAGRFHASLADPVGVASGVALRLPRWDADRLRWGLARAQRHADRRGGSWAEQLDAAAVVHEVVVERLTSALQTVIHGELYPSNILVAPNAAARGGDVRICAIDWETASIGPALIDVAALTEGDWSDDERSALLETYLLARDGVLSEQSIASASRELVCARLQLAIERAVLPTSVIPADHARDWFALASRLAEVVT